MKLLVPCTLLAALAALPLTGSASSGTLHFRGALVEATCQAAVTQPAATALMPTRPDVVALHVHDCRIAPNGGAGSHAVQAKSAQAEPVTLAPMTADMAGTAVVMAVTVSYL